MSTTFPKTDDGIGEYIEFDITLEPLNRDVAITLRILGGYVDPLKPYLFKENGRPKNTAGRNRYGIQ